MEGGAGREARCDLYRAQGKTSARNPIGIQGFACLANLSVRLATLSATSFLSLGPAPSLQAGPADRSARLREIKGLHRRCTLSPGPGPLHIMSKY